MKNTIKSFRKVKCPTCGEETVFSPANPSRPFCSQRCRTLDLGTWAQEKFRIPVADSPEAIDGFDSPENLDEENY